MKVDESKINRESNRMLDITGFVEEANGSNNYPQYLFNEYKRLYENEKYSQALEYLIRSLNKGFPNAEFGMGQHYYLGSEQLELSKTILRLSIASLSLLNRGIRVHNTP